MTQDEMNPLHKLKVPTNELKIWRTYYIRCRFACLPYSLRALHLSTVGVSDRAMVVVRGVFVL